MFITDGDDESNDWYLFRVRYFSWFVKWLYLIRWFFWDKPKLKKEFQLGKIYEGCNCHIGMAIEINYWKNYIVLRSLFNDKSYTCSLSACGVREVQANEIYRLLTIYRYSGIEGIHTHYSIHSTLQTDIRLKQSNTGW